MEERPESCERVTSPLNKSDHLPRGDAIISDHHVNAGSKLSALVASAEGKFRVVEKPALSEAYTVLLFFSSPTLTKSCVKLIATSKLTEERLKTYPSKVKIVSDGEVQINKANVVMVKRLILFEQVLPLDDLKQNNQNDLMSKDEELHIKWIAVDQTANSNIIILVTETMQLPCYLADENNQCGCRYVLELLRRLRCEPSRKISQKLQYDSTSSPASMPQDDTLHVCKFCGKALINAKKCGRICDNKCTIKDFRTRLESRTVSNLKPKSKRKRKKFCGCCSRKRKGRDQSEAYIPKRENDYSSVDYETKTERGGNTNNMPYNVCPNCKPCPECLPFPESNPFPENKTYYSENKSSSKPFAKSNRETVMVLRQECSAAEKGFIASAECCISDSQAEQQFEDTEFYLICQAYQLKSENHACNKYNRRVSQRNPDTVHEQSQIYKPQRDHVHCSRAGKCTDHVTTFDASEKSTDYSTKSTAKQSLSEEEIKEISIQSTDSYVVAERLKNPKKDYKLLVGRMEGSNFKTYPFRDRNNTAARQCGVAEPLDRCRRLASSTSTSSSGSFLSYGRRRSKLSSFPQKLGFCTSLQQPKTRDCQFRMCDLIK